MSYSWQGMKKITRQEAVERFNVGLEVYRLYDDNTEGLCEELSDIMDPAFDDFDFGYETGIPIEAYCGEVE